MTADVLTRVRYFDKQFLRATDFTDEQEYHLAIHRRHALTHHTPGILAGLELQSDSGVAFVAPGIAIDGYGRELVLQKTPIKIDRFTQLNTNQLEVWLFYQRDPIGISPGNTCGPAQYNRLTESARVELSVPGIINPPTGNPNLETPDDPLRLWPVYLGKVTYNPIDPNNTFTFVLDGRTYAGAVASAIHHPTNGVTVGLGDNAAEVFTVDTGSGGPRLEIRTDQTNILRGDTTVDGNLRLNGGMLQFPKPIQVDAPAGEPSIYRFSGDSTDQLRIDLGDVSAGTTRQFVIGHNKDNNFIPALTLAFSEEGGEITPQVTIHGDLRMEGILYAPDTKYRVLSAEVLTALQAMFQSGLAAGGSK